MRTLFRSRLRILLGILTVLALIVVVRLYIVQIVQGSEYSAEADKQYMSNSNTSYDRGSIYFTRKDGTLISAATLKTGFIVAINPKTLQNPEKAFNAINSVQKIDRNSFFVSVKKKKSLYEKILEHLPQSKGIEIYKKHIRGVIVTRERWRYYPGKTIAAHSVGFVAYNNDNSLNGRYGLERYYNNTLTRDGNTYKNFFAQLFSNLGDVFVNTQASREGDIVTTIEPNVESRLMIDLAKIQEKYKSKETGGIIMVPATGEIIALGSVPSFDPNNFESSKLSVLANPLVEHVYEYGSIMKPITMASALDSGVVTPSTTYNDTGCIHVNNRRICNWDYKARGVIPMKEIIIQSLNVGASWLAEKMGQDRFRKYFTELFGQKTGIDLPNETGALLNNLKSSEQINYDTASFGQGVAETPIQMIRALGALANGGIMVEPHLVKTIQLQSGGVKKLDWSRKTKVFSSKSVKETAQMMTDLTDIELDHGRAKIPTMSVAVKTGTAQLVKPTGGYYKNKFFHSFVGFFPSYSPRFIILLYTNNPQGAKYSAETLASSFLDLTHFLINYYDLSPDRNLQNI